MAERFCSLSGALEMKQIYTFPCLFLFSGVFSIANAQFIATTWRVTGMVDET